MSSTVKILVVCKDPGDFVSWCRTNGVLTTAREYMYLAIGNDTDFLTNKVFEEIIFTEKFIDFITGLHSRTYLSNYQNTLMKEHLLPKTITYTSGTVITTGGMAFEPTIKTKDLDITGFIKKALTKSEGHARLKEKHKYKTK